MIVGTRMRRRKTRGRLGEAACKMHFAGFFFSSTGGLNLGRCQLVYLFRYSPAFVEFGGGNLGYREKIRHVYNTKQDDI